MTIRWRGALTLQGYESGDHRILELVTWRELPLTLRIQTEDFGAHDGASPVATIDLMETSTIEAMAALGFSIPEGAVPIYAEGTFSESEAGQLAAQWVEEKVLRGVSVDPGKIEYVEELIDPATGLVVAMDQIMETWDQIDAAEILGDEQEQARLYDWLESLYYRVRFTLYEVAAATLVATPAFGPAVIEIIPAGEAQAAASAAPASGALGIRGGPSAAERLAALTARPAGSSARQRLSGLIRSDGHRQVAAFSPGRMIAAPASAAFRPSEAPEAQPEARRQASGPQVMRAGWFQPDPKGTGREKFTITPEGQMRGYLFTWESCHRSVAGRCETASFMRADIEAGARQFHVGEARLDDGSSIRVGALTHADLHAGGGPELTAEQLVQLMENTGLQLGPVRLHADQFGVQACGQVYEDVTPAQAARALAGFPSYDARRAEGVGPWELFGLHVVTTPGHAHYEETDGELVRMVASIAPPLGPHAQAALAEIAPAPACGCGGHTAQAGASGCSCTDEKLGAQQLAALASLDEAMAARRRLTTSRA